MFALPSSCIEYNLSKQLVNSLVVCRSVINTHGCIFLLQQRVFVTDSSTRQISKYCCENKVLFPVRQQCFQTNSEHFCRANNVCLDVSNYLSSTRKTDFPIKHEQMSAINKVCQRMCLAKMLSSLPALGNMEKQWQKTMFPQQFSLVFPYIHLQAIP